MGNALNNYKEFTSKDGFEVFNVSAMLFDDLGWLWIAGTNLNANNSLHNYHPIIQRYDGKSFYTIELPEFNEGADPKIYIIKRPDGKFYVSLISSKSFKLFLVDPQDLDFEEIILPTAIKYDDLFLFADENYAMVYLRSGIDTRVYHLNHENLDFEELQHKPITKRNLNDIPYYKNYISLNNHFIIDDSRQGIYSYNLDGSVDRKITKESLGLSNREDIKKLHINSWFKKGDDIYVHFDDIDAFYLYNWLEKSWTRSSIFQEKENETNFLNTVELVFTDGQDNVLRQRVNLNVQVNSILYKDQSEKIVETPSLTGSQIASRDFTKELYIEFDGIFRHYSFLNEGSTTFLKNKSIRGFLQLNDDEVLVATESSGWYIINLTTKSEHIYELKINDKLYLASENRAIFNSEDYYWSNDSKGIIKVNKKTQETTSFVYYPIGDMVTDERYIYYGTTVQNLMKFDKLLEENSILTSTKDYNVQGILKLDDAIYLATTTGFLVYKNNALQHYNIDTSADDSYLIAIEYHEKYGVLVGSRSGKLYQFNTEDKTFNLLYEDELKASIASILFDDEDNIWLNTFNGIVAFNPESNTISRYNMTDGLSFYEANRYSALKLENGHFLVGTLKGLNYFNPKTISKNKIDASLQLTTLTYFNKEASKEVTELAPKVLRELSTINLPSDSRSINIKFGLLGIYDSKKINYRYSLNDGPWIHLKYTSELSLFSLSAGEYSLKIEAIDLAEHKIGDALVVSITVAEFFYKTFWFYALVSLTLLALSFWYFLEQRKKFQLKAQFANQIISSQEQERSRIAKDLHDSIGQRLLILKNTLLTNTETRDMSLIEDTIKEVRTMSHNLHPFQFEQLGLVKSLCNMMDAFQKSSDVFYSYDIEDISGLIPKENELFLFRMLQECITNVEKHAQATACNLTVKKVDTSIIFKLKDNGIGFSVENTKNSQTSLGMKSLQERAQYINAIFDIKSVENKGTTITIKLKH